MKFFPLFLFAFQTVYAQQGIDRKALVERHTITNNKFDSLSSLSLGNGSFAFTVDVTGLQSFPDAYAKGVPLGTQSEWSWHSFIDTAGYSFNETLKEYSQNGRMVSYSVQLREPERKKNATDWFRQNPHRFHLGNIGFDLQKKDGSPATIHDIQNIRQTLNMWTGEIHSQFTLEDVGVDVITVGHQQEDAIAVRVNSTLLREGRLKIRIRFPYPTGEWTDAGNFFLNANRHTSSIISKTSASAILQHALDKTSYYTSLVWKGGASLIEKSPHYFIITPAAKNSFEYSFSFTENRNPSQAPSFSVIKGNSNQEWIRFWQSGAAVDFTGSTDTRSFELERRIILSQYLTKIQCAGYYPPQETGLTYNSWYGRPHIEMHWWHTVHFSLWGRNELMERSLSWYKGAYDKAKQLAKRQGYEGVRWQKMTDNNGNETPSSVGAFLIWQQPHIIYFAELAYRQHKDSKTLNSYSDLIFATADFMASFAFYDTAKGKYILGPALIPAQERFKPEGTFNPAFELVYWTYALNIAQKWRERLQLPRNTKWDDVLNKLSSLATRDGKYLFTESRTDSYTNPEFRTDHPSVLGALGIMPQTKMVDTITMNRTFSWIWNNWSWNETWGWDFPMTAMSATRLGMPEKAIEALLMPIETNTYLNNGHNYQDKRLTIYLPGNGGLLAAVAMMCAGFDGCKTDNPGIPKNGKWKVRWEKLRRMP